MKGTVYASYADEFDEGSMQYAARTRRIGWSQPMISRSRVSLAILAASVSLFGCSADRAVGTVVTREALLAALTPELASIVGADGRIKLGPPVNTGHEQISAEKAGALAVGMARFNAPSNNAYYETRRGGAIAYQKLSLCSPPLYAATPFEWLDVDDPNVTVHPLQKAVGPIWLVTLCADGDPEMDVAVAAYSTDLGLNSDGSVDFPPIGGNDFFSEAIPIGRFTDELPSAEAAVVFAATSTGRRVAAVPELVATFYRYDDPLESRWHLRLDGPAHIQSAAGTVVESSDIYISRIRTTNRPGSRVWSADPVQPPEVDVVFFPTLRVGENFNDYLIRQQAGLRTLHPQRLPNMPISFTGGSPTH